MKRIWKVCALAALLMFAVNANATMLFSDSFDRADNLDINAGAPTGMGGTLGATMTYVERDLQLITDAGGDLVMGATLTNIENNQLHLADGPNMGIVYMDHNFTDGQITADGGMKIGMTIVSDDGTKTDINRFCGFGVGNTLTEAQNAFWDFNGVGFRGRVATWAGTSDMWIGWSPNGGGVIQVFKNGPTGIGDGENYDIAVGALTGADQLELKLYFDSFADGSAVTAQILWNGAVVGTDSFNWDADTVEENYIAINARQDGAGFTVDNLAIETIPEPATMLLLGLGGLLLRKRK